MRKVHRKEMDLAFDPGDLRQRLTKIHLRVTGIVPQRHKHLAVLQPVRPRVVPNNGDPAAIAVLVTKPFEDPLRGVPLLLRPPFIRSQDRRDDPDKRVQLRTYRRPAPGTENASIFATVRGSIPKRRAASRRLTPSI